MPPKIDKFSSPLEDIPKRIKRIRSSPELNKSGIKKHSFVLSEVATSSTIQLGEVGLMSKNGLIQCMEILINKFMDARLTNLATKDDIEELRVDNKCLKEDSRQLREELDNLKVITAKQ